MQYFILIIPKIKDNFHNLKHLFQQKFSFHSFSNLHNKRIFPLLLFYKIFYVFFLPLMLNYLFLILRGIFQKNLNQDK